MLADAKINPELIGTLGEGLRTFGDKVASISKVADAGAATNEFAAKLKTASAGYDNLSTAFAKASASFRLKIKAARSLDVVSIAGIPEPPSFTEIRPYCIPVLRH